MEDRFIKASLKILLLEMNFDPVLEKLLFHNFERKDIDFNFLSYEAYQGEIPNFYLCKRKPFTRLTVVLYKLEEVQQKFIDKKIPMEIFFDTISDIKLRQQLYFKKTNKYGLSKEDVIWFRHIFNFVIFKLGSLQFQIFHMIYLDDYMQFSIKQKEKLQPNAPVINVHIQTGADLSDEAVTNSFEKADDFFLSYFPEHKFVAYICYSWLLYSGNQLLLSMNSKILRFAKRFEIIGEINDNEQALEYIFMGQSLKNFPVSTSLQKNALRNLKALGYACGVIYGK